MNNAKIWILVTGIVTIVSGFLLYSMIRSRETEKANFMLQMQELTGRVGEIDKLKVEIDNVKKEKADLEVKAQSDLSAVETQLADTKKSETQIKSKLDTLTKEKDSMTKYMENSNQIIAKLNKKIEAVEKERDTAIELAKQEASVSPGPVYADPMTQAGGEQAPAPAPAAKEPMGAKLAEEEIVDLGRIIVHESTNEPAQVEHVNPLYGFVVMSAGTKDGLRRDSVVNITRNNRLIAKAVIKKIRDDVSSAVTLPEWTREEIRVGDLISVNTPTALGSP